MPVATFAGDNAADAKHEKRGHPVELGVPFISTVVTYAMTLTILCCK